MLLLLFKSSACLAAFLFFYKLFLEKESMHHFKRFYLLGALLVSIVIPFITFTQYIEVAVIKDYVPLQSAEFTVNSVPKSTTWQDYISTALWTLYTMGVIVFGFRFVKNLKEIVSKIKTNPKHKYHSFTNVLLQDLIPPHTFFNYIFVNKTKYEHNLIPKEVLLHEQTHAKQKHSLDVLIIEVLQIVFWFNPLIYLIKKDIKLNHEFLADRAVLDKGITALQYKKTLLAFSSNAKEPTLANAINYSSIKKRFTVMKTKTSKQVFWFRSLILLPILAILIYSFSEVNMVEKEVTSMVLPTTQQTSKTNKSITPESYYAETRFISYKKGLQYSDTIIGKGIIINKLYSDLTDNEKKTFPFSSHVPKPKQKKSPTQEEVEYIKDQKIFAIWIDGEHVPNTKLNKYKPQDFAYYSGRMFIHKTGRKKRPQPFWCTLYTHEYFDEHKMGEQKTKYHGTKVEMFKSLEKINGNFQQEATKEQLAEYNKLAKKLGSQPEGQQIIKFKDLNRLKYLYSLMSAQQKKNAEAFPKIAPPPPPPPPTPKKLEIIQLKEVPPPPPHTQVLSPNKKESKALLEAKKEFQLKGNEYGKAVNTYLKEKKGNVSNLKAMYKEVMTLYDAYMKLAKKGKAVIPPPPPPMPKVIEVKKNKSKDFQTDTILEIHQQPNIKTTEPIKYHTIITPLEGEFQITLSDGTKVLLKSETKLKYPTKFTKGEPRKVELIYGEAFFEVVPSNEYYSSTFKVITNGKEIDVSGTKLIEQKTN